MVTCNAVRSVLILLTAYFIFILVFGESRYRPHSFIIAASSLMAIVLTNEMPETKDTARYLKYYIMECNISIMWSGVTALALTMVMFFDKVAWKQALLLTFATFCHVMMVYDLTVSSSMLSHAFYSYYDELIIIVGLLQMAVSYDGFIRALNEMEALISRSIFYCNGIRKSLFAQEKRKGNT